LILFPKKDRACGRLVLILAGLLTCSIFKLPSRSFSEQWKKYCSKTFGGAYSSGAVQDFHLIPFSMRFPKRNSITKTGCKDKHFFLMREKYHFKIVGVQIKLSYR
jgi:hypothetical protein